MISSAVIIILGLYFAMVATNVWADYSQIKSGKWIDHTQETILNFIAVFMICIIYGVFYYDWLTALALFLIYWPMRWLFFDLLLNLFRGKPFDYLGEGKNTSQLDLFLDVYPFMQYPIKLLLLLVVIILDLWILKLIP